MKNYLKRKMLEDIFDDQEDKETPSYSMDRLIRFLVSVTKFLLFFETFVFSSLMHVLSASATPRVVKIDSLYVSLRGVFVQLLFIDRFKSNYRHPILKLWVKYHYPTRSNISILLFMKR